MNATTEWYVSTSVSPNSQLITEATETLPANMYSISGTEKNVLFDTGLGVGDLRAFLADVTDDRPTQVILSHTHWDHLGNASQFDDVAVHPRERGQDGQIAIDTLSDEFIDRPQQFVENRREQGKPFPDEFDPDAFDVAPVESSKAIDMDGTILLGERALEIIEIPGHSPGQIALLDEHEGILYGADLVHVDTNAYLHFEDSSLDDYLDSLERVIDLYERGAFETLVTGHNPPMGTDELDILYALEEGLQSIAAGELDGERIETDWGDALKYEVGDSKVLTKVNQL